MEDKPDKTPDVGPSPTSGSRKRPPPTIDLSASEVSEVPQQKAAADDSASSVPPKKGWRARFAGAQPDESVSHDESASMEQDRAGQDAEEPIKQRAPSRASTAIIAAVSGGVAALVVAGSWMALESNLRAPGSESAVPAQTLAVDALNARLTKLESRPSPPSVTRDDEKLQSALATLDGEVTSLRKEVGSLRAQIETASANVASLKSSAAGGTPSVALTGVEDRLSKLEQGLTALSQSQPATEPAIDAPLRRAVVATSLDQSVSQGAPYAVALAAAAKLDENAEALRPLQAFATTGVPGAAEMSRELLKLLKPLDAEPAAVPASASLLDRLKAGVSGLVRITRVDQSGTGRAALLMRATAAAQREDVAEAGRLVMQLPDQDRAVLKNWIDKATARDAALAASRQFAQEATAALPKSSPRGAQ
ncbi:MAG: hypothetical protein K2W78_12085 [Xanthobacteraceae bacterium]|nr:hypothetical protein [Xanthobacteraceae bacterium]